MSRLFNILITPKEASLMVKKMPVSLRKGARIEVTCGSVFDKERLIGLLKDKDGVVLDLETIDSEVLKACPRLKVISRYGEGYDAIDIKEAKRRGVRVTRTRGVASTAVARHAFALILSLTHNVTFNDRALKKGKWEKVPNLSDGSMRLGILGAGHIGRRLASLAGGYGFSVLVYDEDKGNCRGLKQARNVKDLFRRSDVISLHIPLSGRTRNIISSGLLKGLKDKFVVNTSRGGLVDEEAMIKALEDGRVCGYAADVFLNEPLKGVSSRLAKHPRVICSPHVSALDADTAKAMAKRAFENAVNSLNNKHDKVVSYVI